MRTKRVDAKDNAKKLCAKKLYTGNIGLIGLCLRRFPLLTGDDREDAYGAGMLGLWNAAQSFDPARGFRFSSYATDCIRYALLSHIQTQKRQRRLPCVSLDAPVGDDGSGGELADMIAGDTPPPDRNALDEAGFNALLAPLKPGQQDVLRAVYQQELTLAEIGAAWGTSKQRCGQIHMQALSALRPVLRARQRGY